MPRTSRAQTAANREALVHAASALLREQGPAALTLDAVASRAGLTHGGFYKQFASRDALIAEAVDHATAERRDAVIELQQTEGREGVLDWYLSAAHRDDPADGCVVAALAGETAHTPAGPLGDGIRTAIDDLVRARQRAGDTSDEARQDALAEVAMMIGAVELARATVGTPISDELLAAVRARLS